MTASAVDTAEPGSGAASPADRGVPHRVLVVSADMGGGHNATANALEEAGQWLQCSTFKNCAKRWSNGRSAAEASIRLPS